MSIRVKRATGMMGGTTKVALEVDNQLVKKLKNNEEYTITSDAEQVTMKAKQLIFGSEERQVERGSTVNIKINNNAVLLYIVSLLAMLFGTMITPVITIIGLIGAVVTVIYSTRKWFKLEVVQL
jgi:hypothetical protein